MTAGEWWGPGQAWLCRKAAEHFSAWAASKSGAKWRKNRHRSPYYYSYAQPQWIRDACDALGRHDEAGFKAIKLAHL